MKLSIEDRAANKAKKVIGIYTRIQTSKTGTQGGTIIDCKFDHIKPTKTSQKVIYKLTLESGTKKVISHHLIDKLPKV